MKGPWTPPPVARYPSAQRGVVLVVGLILLVLITLIVVSAFGLSISNLKSVTNLQRRDEAIAAGNAVIETMISSDANFKAPPGAVFSPFEVDIDDNGTPDFRIQPTVTCVRALQANIAALSEQELGKGMSSPEVWILESDLAVTVTDLSGSGASVVIHQGVMTQMSTAERNIACP